MSPDKPKVLLFLNGYHKNVFHIFMWKLLLISFGLRVNLCVCACVHIGINLGKRCLADLVSVTTINCATTNLAVALVKMTVISELGNARLH